MTVSRSTPRLRLTALLLLGVLALVATTERTTATGIAGLLLQLVGLACIACAALGRVWASVFIAGYKDAQLVRGGPYSVLRHPLYALSLLAMLGAGLTTRSVTLTAALLVVFVDCVKELPATLLLRPFNYNTLSTRVYELASLERLSEAAQVGGDDGVALGEQGQETRPGMGGRTGAVQKQKRRTIACNLHMPVDAGCIDDAAGGAIGPIVRVSFEVQWFRHRRGLPARA